jgi:hypothetical protein
MLHIPLRLSCSVMFRTLIMNARSAPHGHSQRTTRSTPTSSRMAIYCAPTVPFSLSYLTATHPFTAWAETTPSSSLSFDRLTKSTGQLGHPFRCASRYMGTVGRTRAHHARQVLPYHAQRRALVKYECVCRHPVQDDCASPAWLWLSTARTCSECTVTWVTVTRRVKLI